MKLTNDEGWLVGLCCNCVDDTILKSKIEAAGSRGPCAVCGRTDSAAIDISTLTAMVKNVIETHFDLHVELYRGFDGLELEQVVAKVLGMDLSICNDIAQLLVVPESEDPYQDRDEFFGEWQSYSPKRLPEGVSEWWHDVAEELKHTRRFFSQRIIDFFAGIATEAIGSERNTIFGRKPAGAVATMREGAILFRARSASSEDEMRQIIEDPQGQLGAPPPAHAKDGRMNPSGVPVFYGAEQFDTAVAEVRPSIGHTVIVGTFESTRPLKLFNFCELDHRLSLGRLSYFDPDYEQKRNYRDIVKGLHDLIAQPVLPDAEREYLITQALAEYLAYVHDEPFDGVRFKSVQHPGGVNVVVFRGDPYRDGAWFSRAGNFPIQWTNKTPTKRIIEAIRYETRVDR